MSSNRLLMNTSQDGGSVVHVWPSSCVSCQQSLW